MLEREAEIGGIPRHTHHPSATFSAGRAASQAALDGIAHDLTCITCRGKKWLGV